MKTLKDVSKQYRKSAAKAIYPGVSYPRYRRSSKSKLRPNPQGQESRAFQTGNLLTKFIQSPQNSIDKIGSKIQDGFQIVINIAPNGADYGRWVHNGTTRMIARPFGELATEDPDFQEVLDEFLLTQVDVYVDGELDMLDTAFNKAGFSVS